jgi:hypothetical protein
MQIPCIHCGTRIDLAEDFSATMARCPQCGLVVPVLQVGDPLPPPPLPDWPPPLVTAEPAVPPLLGQTPEPLVLGQTPGPVLDVVLVDSVETVTLSPMPLPGSESVAEAAERETAGGEHPLAARDFAAFSSSDHRAAEVERARRQRRLGRGVIAVVGGTMIGTVVGAAAGASGLQDEELFGRGMVGALAGLLLCGVWFAILGWVWGARLAEYRWFAWLIGGTCLLGTLAGASFGASVTVENFRLLAPPPAAGLGALGGALAGAGLAAAMLRLFQPRQADDELPLFEAPHQTDPQAGTEPLHPPASGRGRPPDA